MSNATSVPQPSLYHTNVAAFGAALRAVAPDIFREAHDYRERAQQEYGIAFTEDEAIGRAVKVLLSLAEADADDEIEPDYDPTAIPDYNDDELLHCGIER
jgi:hypothetical protein